MDDKTFAVEFLDLVSLLPENIGASEYQCPIVSDGDGKLQLNQALQRLLDDPINTELKEWATIERIQNLF